MDDSHLKNWTLSNSTCFEVKSARGPCGLEPEICLSEKVKHLGGAIMIPNYQGEKANVTHEAFKVIRVVSMSHVPWI